MEKKAEANDGQCDTEDSLNGVSSKNSKVEVENDDDSEDMSKDDADSENCTVIKDVGSDVITQELVLKRNVNKQNENSELTGKEKQCLQQQNKRGSYRAKPDCDLSTNQTSESPLLDRGAGDWSANYSRTFIRPKIISGPGDILPDTHPWTKDSIFDNLKFTISPLTTRSERLQYCQLMEKCRNLRSVPETSYIDGDSYVSDQQASFLKVTHEAFTNTRLATLRKTPASLVLSKFSPDAEVEKASYSSRDSALDLTVGMVRMDEVQMGSPRFDPYHSDCGPDCRKCFFLTQTQNLPHLTSKVIKAAKAMDASVSSKSQKKKFGFGFPSTKSRDSQRPA